MTDVTQAPQEVATTPATPPTFVLPAGTVLRDVKFSFKKADPVTGNKRPPVNLKIPQVTTDYSPGTSLPIRKKQLRMSTIFSML
jgi:hypothetical protein